MLKSIIEESQVRNLYWFITAHKPLSYTCSRLIKHLQYTVQNINNTKSDIWSFPQIILNAEHI